MKPEPEEIERLARFLCERADKNPDGLRAGNCAFHSSFDPDLFMTAEYDNLFDRDGEFKPDGFKENGDPAMFKWRDHVEDAVAIRKFLNLSH